MTFAYHEFCTFDDYQDWSGEWEIVEGDAIYKSSIIDTEFIKQ